MNESCFYHPTQPAHWRCPECQTAYCPDCISKRQKLVGVNYEDAHWCPKCNVEAVWVGAANLIKPFWARLPQFFLYPFKLHPFGLILALSLAGILLSGESFLFAILRIVLWGILLKYSFSALRATAKGNLIPPKINSETISEDFFQVFKQVGLYVAIGISFLYISAKFGPIIGLLFLIFALGSIPAMLILLVTTGSLIHALNPVLSTRLALRIGWGYFLMYFFLMLLGSAPAALGYYLYQFLPTGLAEFLFGLAKNYYTVISYHLMGYVILQYHQEVGYQIEMEDFQGFGVPVPVPTTEEPDKNSDLINQVSILAKEGKLDEAIDYIQKQTAGGGISDLALSEKYFKLLKMKKRGPELFKHCLTHVNLLCRENQKDKALPLYNKCLAHDKNFAPEADAMFKIGGWLNENGKIKNAIAIYQRLIKTYPNSSVTPKAYLRAAQLFYDRLMKPEQARKILDAVLRKYPDHEIAPKAKAYLGSLGA
jgi:tetratricopeptide (TPR) repeat protein